MNHSLLLLLAPLFKRFVQKKKTKKVIVVIPIVGITGA